MLPKRGVGRGSVGGRWTTRTETKVQKEVKKRVGRGGRREFARKGGGPSLSAADGRVHMDRRWRGGGSTGGAVVTWHDSDSERHAVFEGR